MGQTDRGDGRGGAELQKGWEGLLGCSQPGSLGTRPWRSNPTQAPPWAALVRRSHCQTPQAQGA